MLWLANKWWKKAEKRQARAMCPEALGIMQGVTEHSCCKQGWLYLNTNGTQGWPWFHMNMSSSDSYWINWLHHRWADQIFPPDSLKEWQCLPDQHGDGVYTWLSLPQNIKPEKPTTDTSKSGDSKALQLVSTQYFFLVFGDVQHCDGEHTTETSNSYHTLVIVTELLLPLLYFLSANCTGIVITVYFVSLC